MTELVSIAVKSRHREEMIDITADIAQVVAASGVKAGLVHIQVMHTTAAVTINENADPDVTQDMLWKLAEMVPNHREFKHQEGNSDAHVKSSLVGPALTVHVNHGRLVLGTWQGIYFCEFDGPRQRNVLVRVID